MPHQLEIGRIKNINHNPVAEKAVQEMESEILRQVPRTESLTPRSLALVTARLNTRICSNGLSSREMWFQRDQHTNEQIPFADCQRIMEQHEQRHQNHKYSEQSKCPNATALALQDVTVGDIVYLYYDKTKHEPRSRYLITSIEDNWCSVRKFVGNTLRKLTYRVKRSECYKVPSEILPAQPHLLTNDDDDTITTGQAEFPLTNPATHPDKATVTPEYMNSITNSGTHSNNPIPPVEITLPLTTPPTETPASPLPSPSSTVSVNVNPLDTQFAEDTVSPTEPTSSTIVHSESIGASSCNPVRRSGRSRTQPQWMKDYVI